MTEGPTPEPKPPSAPRWVKVAALVAGLFLAALLVMALSGGGHGPGRHFPGGGDHAPADPAP